MLTVALMRLPVAAANTPTPAAVSAPEAPPPPAALPPSVIEQRFWSDTLEREMPYTIYLPPSYHSTGARYPVLYLLHGLGGDDREWARIGIAETATEMAQRGDVPPMIIVMPEGERGYWADKTDGPQYGSYVSRDLVSHIDEQYRTIPSRGSRAIGGLSMGAHGALDIGFNNPDEFGVIGAHSLALRRAEDALEFFGSTQNWAGHNPRSICARSGEIVRRAGFTMWLDIGSDDRWIGENRAFHAELVAAGIEHEWRESPGGHDWAYWRTHQAEYLSFYGDAFRAASRRETQASAANR